MNREVEKCARDIGKLLSEKNLTISCAESCTGGLLTSVLTDVPGSSSYLIGSVVSYANDIKSRIVGVSEESLASYGAVSEIVAHEMAAGIRSLIGTDIGVGITGIAGPGGGTDGKPVGLVYIAVALQERTIVTANYFSGTRTENKTAAVQRAIMMIEDMIRSIE
ncbi:CinA family protein [Selenomonas sp. F0473]|uniref:CinA family protein n=1 Tax=Selenomonas sp. F0473 TaxID=999423 RepID=UPI00029E66F7|nr:CinA family protein [Selenomonas sp. F0473]EKU71679.1 competence/damage-inducible protein CinA domain [Selenomonas sp. F0473]